jgi:hypothetical protein
LIPDELATSPEPDYIVDWQSTKPDHAEAIKAFWLRERAIEDGEQAQSRMSDVVLHAQDQAGAIVAVCTAARIDVIRLKQPMYYYRAFVTAAWRKHGVAISMLQRAKQCLSDYARSRDFPCIGIVIEIQSRELRDIGNQPYWPRTQFNFIGQSAAGLNIFVHYFEGAKLKA